MKKIIVTILVLVLVGMGGYFLLNKNSEPNTQADVMPTQSIEPSPSASSEPVVTGVQDTTVSASSSPEAMSGVKEFTVFASNFKFSVGEIKVKKGDKVRIIFKNENGTHDWVLDEFNVKTKRVPAGESDTVEFVADKTGTFEYYCSVGSHRQMGMKGNLIVE